MDLTKFMEMAVRESNYVILLRTPNFAKKANAGVGGVGYEKTIVTGKIFADEVEETKFVPVLREGDAKESLPSYLKNRLFVEIFERMTNLSPDSKNCFAISTANRFIQCPP
jgi:hypothetical protein